MNLGGCESEFVFGGNAAVDVDSQADHAAAVHDVLVVFGKRHREAVLTGLTIVLGFAHPLVREQFVLDEQIHRVMRDA